MEKAKLQNKALKPEDLKVKIINQVDLEDSIEEIEDEYAGLQPGRAAKLKRQAKSLK